jgi:hypothetical protein
VNRAEIETFKRRVRDLLDRYEQGLHDIERDEAIRRDVPAATLRGQGREIALEAQARIYLLDPLLRELGWEVQAPAAIVVEDGVEPVPNGADTHRRRLDYHGRDNAATRSLLAVEVKRPSVRLPQPRDGRPVPEWIAYASGVINTASPEIDDLPAAWREIVESAIDYVKRIEAAYDHTPARFVITNGEWFIVFSDLKTTLLARDPVAGSIDVFNDLEDVNARAERFCGLLGYRNLSGYIPPQHPAALPDFVPEGQEAVCARFIEMDYIRHGERQPLISVSVGAWVRTPRGAWILFRKTYPRQFLVLNDKLDELAARRAELNERAESLLADLRNHRNVRFASREEFEGPQPEIGVGRAEDLASPLVRGLGRGDLGQDRYRIVTLDEGLYFTEDATYDGCPYHSWGPCREEGDAVGDSAITAPSSDPRCFFPSGSPYHCAHAGIQARRVNVCLLLPFEQHLCCRRCVFLSRCWPDTAVMPCRQH